MKYCKNHRRVVEVIEHASRYCATSPSLRMLYTYQHIKEQSAIRNIAKKSVTRALK